MNPGGAAIVVLAAGSGRRLGGETNKVLLPLGGLPLLAHSVRTALRVDGVRRIVVVVRPEDRAEVEDALNPVLGPVLSAVHDHGPGVVDPAEVWLVDGGAERHDSEDRALQALRAAIESGEIGVVAIHDAARPMASAALFIAALSTAADHGGAVPALDSPRLSAPDGQLISGRLAAVQTPQAFSARQLLRAYDAAREDGFGGTDTAACLERYAGTDIVAIPGEAGNLKVTWASDLPLAEQLLSSATG